MTLTLGIAVLIGVLVCAAVAVAWELGGIVRYHQGVADGYGEGYEHALQRLARGDDVELLHELARRRAEDDEVEITW